MEKILMIHDCKLNEVQKHLDDGWKVKMIEPVGKGFGAAFVVLEKTKNTGTHSVASGDFSMTLEEHIHPKHSAGDNNE